MAYKQFVEPRALQGKVETKDGDTFEGRIFYDMDETWDMEILDGNDGDIEYLIPFRSIKSIVPDGRWGAEVTLTDGRKLVLEESRDINDDNAGLIIQSDKKLRYIEWRDIKGIHFSNR
jgi:hypothetical protein